MKTKFPQSHRSKEMRDLALLQTRVLSCYATAKQHIFYSTATIARALASSSLKQLPARKRKANITLFSQVYIFEKSFDIQYTTLEFNI